MLVEFSIVPVGIGSSIGDSIAKVLGVVDSSGLPYKVNPMGTVVEGDWSEVMGLIKKCHGTIMNDGERAITTICIDDRKNKPNRLEMKILSVEERLGKKLRK